MFHHFHGENHPKVQGSIDSIEFEQILSWLEQNYNLLSADVFLDRFLKEKLGQGDICLSFDDALLCQFEIAVPILAKKDLSSFFFVYSSILTGNPDYLEIYRYFRTTCFTNIDDFYSKFFELVKVSIGPIYSENMTRFSKSNYLVAYPFYSWNDRWFRFLRDNVLGRNAYSEIMSQLMIKENFDPVDCFSKLWMGSNEIKQISCDGHLVGLHSHSHPTKMSDLTFYEQKHEYETNFQHLKKLTRNMDLVSMSHPCGDFNADTLEVLESLGIKIGFGSSMKQDQWAGRFCVPREDHSNVAKAIKSEIDHIYR